MLTKVRMINFLDGWVNKANGLGDGNDSNKTKSTKREKAIDREKERERKKGIERKKKRKKERTSIGRQDEDDVISRSPSSYSSFSFFSSSWLIVLLSHLTLE